MSSNFKPVIYQEASGICVFRNDLIDIEFPLETGVVTKRFELGEQLAPPIPFLRSNHFYDGNRERVYVIDPMGDVWVENDNENMVWIIAQHFLVLLMQIGSSEFDPAADIIRTLESSSGDD